ncbi:serine hydrolase domain-containing protein [Nonomuraea sp. NPDC050310]|uniref:serine hydrolase domain-containing protein n=1 Tax=Nonomuraea sp. NPDC050310 TaxID=3154935 RepID=UPI0033CFB42B
MRSRIVATAAALTLLTVATPAHAGQTDPATLQRAADEIIARGGGSTVLQVLNGNRRTTVTSGIGNLQTGEPIPAGSLFRVGSISKPFIAVTVLQLVGEGRIDLDASIDRYLTGLGLPYSSEVTVRGLLDMNARVADFVPAYWALHQDDLAWLKTHRFRSWSTQELVDLAKTLPRPAGYAYSNTNYVILGMLIEKVTGRPYQREVDERIAKPLGLRDTYFPYEEVAIRGPHARQYAISPQDPGTHHDISDQNTTYLGAAGALVSTPADLITFNRALLKGKLLGKRLLRQMMTFATVADDPTKSMGLGYMSWTLPPCGKTIYGFGGRVLGTYSALFGTGDGKDEQLALSLASHDSNATAPQNARVRELVYETFCD